MRRGMMSGNLVLRNAAAVRTVSPFESFGPSATAAPEPRVEVHNLFARELADVARDPGVAAIAVPMATTLIKPFEASSNLTVTDLWGLTAIKADVSSFTGEGVV